MACEQKHQIRKRCPMSDRTIRTLVLLFDLRVSLINAGLNPDLIEWGASWAAEYYEV